MLTAGPCTLAALKVCVEDGFFAITGCPRSPIAFSDSGARCTTDGLPSVRQRWDIPEMRPETDVAIVGSGPNALSLAAHLRVRGVDFRIFGPPMRFWRDMPVGINLKSFAHATNIFVPTKGTSFPEWCRARGLEDFEPCTMESFAAYGIWMTDRFVADIESVEVSRVSIDRSGRFDLTLANEARLRARRVVFATGLSYLASTPDVFRALPPELLSHTFDLSDYSFFRGKAVAVVGAGASAMEAGALVHEAGGRPQILVREAEAIFHDRIKANRTLLDRLHKPISVLGPGKKNRLMEALPLTIRFIPERRRLRFVKGYLGPAAPWWILSRVQGVIPILVRTTVVGAERHGDRVRLTLSEPGRGERTIEVDHVIAGTGYVPDVDRLAYLDDDFRQRIRRVERSPALSLSFESSVPGAYFVGPITALSFGPLFRFVAGAKYAAPALARHLAGPIRTVTSTARRWVTGAQRQ
jgi:cation diffusion facilitator CzcD-associated flavoprotein CzcO